MGLKLLLGIDQLILTLTWSYIAIVRIAIWSGRAFAVIVVIRVHVGLKPWAFWALTLN